MIDERELKEYRKNRADGLSASQALRYTKGKLRQEFEKNLRGFRVVHESDTPRGSFYTAWVDGDKYEVETDYDTDSRCDFFDFDDFEIREDQPRKNEYPRECVTDVGRKQWLVITDETPAKLAKWYSKTGCSKQVAYEKAVDSILHRMKYYEDMCEGNITEYVVTVRGNGVDECCGGIGDYEEFIWETIS